MIVAASPPTEEAVVATEPLTREDLIAYLASGCKTKDKYRYSLMLICSVKMLLSVCNCDIFLCLCSFTVLVLFEFIQIVCLLEKYSVLLT